MAKLWRSTFLQMSTSGALRKFATRNSLTRQVARRFVAGESFYDALAVIRELNQSGADVELDYLGENVRDPGQAASAADVYLGALDRISSAALRAHVSVKATQMGLDVNPRLCLDNLRKIVERAHRQENFVWVDMESSEYVDRTLDLYRRLRTECPNIGVAIQAYLYRSKADIQSILSIGGTVRLCKGAYMEPSSVAFPDKSLVDRSFAVLSEMLLGSGTFQAIATHDEKMIRHVIRFAKEAGISPQSYEFQMLYGVRRDLQARLVREGHRLRVYVPYGSQWYPYFMRRLAERPANLVFLVSNLVKEAGSKAA